MKSIVFGLMMSAVLLISQAQEEAKPKEGEIKVYKRLIPADVLRGESELSVEIEQFRVWSCPNLIVVDKEENKNCRKKKKELRGRFVSKSPQISFN